MRTWQGWLVAAMAVLGGQAGAQSPADAVIEQLAAQVFAHILMNTSHV